MRWFWLFILGLVMLTGALYFVRVKQENATAVAAAALPAIETKRQASEPRSITPPIVNEQQDQVDPIKAQDDEPVVPEIIDLPIESPIESPNETMVQSDQLDEDAQITEMVDELTYEEYIRPYPPINPTEQTQTDTQPDIEPEHQEQAEPETQVIEIKVPDAQDEIIEVSTPPTQEIPEPSLAPTFERLDNGSIKVLSSGSIITGQGTKADPFVLDWSVLRSVQSGYNPKEGKDHLPDWLDELDSKQVKIVGNTLVPVIATTTREVLVMQNPWDGCCIGIPPSPYDAIEVTLDHDVDFGSSAVGYGTVTGEFYLDPYVVNGWVLGLYIIDNAQYRSGEGVAFPDF